MNKKNILIVLCLMSVFQVLSQESHPLLKISPKGHTEIIDFQLNDAESDIITVGSDNVIHIWDKDDNTLKRTIRGYWDNNNIGKIERIAIDPQSKFLAIAGEYEDGEKKLNIIDYFTGDFLFTMDLETKRPCLDLQFSNEFLLYNNRLETKVWMIPLDFEDGIPDEVYYTRFNNQVILHPTLPLCISNEAGFGTLVLYNLNDDYTNIMNKSLTEEIISMDISPDGTQLITLNKEGDIVLWNISFHAITFETKIKNIGDIEFGGIIKFTSNKKILYSIREAEFKNGRKGNLISVIPLSPEVIDQQTFFSTNSNRPILNIKIDKNKEDLYVLDMTCSFLTKISMIDNKSSQIVNGLATAMRNVHLKENTIYWSETLLLNKYTDYFSLNDKILGEKEFYYKKKIEHGDILIVKDPDKNILYIGDRTLDLTDMSQIINYYFTPNGRNIIIQSLDEIIKIDSTSFKIKNKIVNNVIYYLSSSISEDSKNLITISTDKTIRIYNSENFKIILSIFIGHDNNWIAWTPDGYYESSLNGSNLAGWHFNNGYDKRADYFALNQYRSLFYRPDIISRALNGEEFDIPADLLFYERPPQITSLKIENKEISQNYSVIESEGNTLEIALTSIGESYLENIEIFINGRPFTLKHTKGNPIVKIDNYNLEASFTVFLTKKYTNFRMYTKDIYGFTSEEKNITIKYNGPNALPSYYSPKEKIILSPPEKTLHVLSVGIEKYTNSAMEAEGLKNLNWSEDDADDIVNLFMQQEDRYFKFVEDYHLTLTNRGTDITSVDILEELDNMDNFMDYGDSIVIFLSGHGLRKDGEYFFLTSESDPSTIETLTKTALSWNALGEKLKKMKKAKEIIVLIDACQSGGVKALELGNKWRDMGVVLVTSSMAGQYSYENSDWQNGAFTEAIINSFTKLEDYAPADSSKDNVLLLSEVMKHSVSLVSKMTGDQQTPWMPEYDPYISSKIFGVDVPLNSE